MLPVNAGKNKTSVQTRFLAPGINSILAVQTTPTPFKNFTGRGRFLLKSSLV
jgi:hypothetical protein